MNTSLRHALPLSFAALSIHAACALAILAAPATAQHSRTERARNKFVQPLDAKGSRLTRTALSFSESGTALQLERFVNGATRAEKRFEVAQSLALPFAFSRSIAQVSPELFLVTGFTREPTLSGVCSIVRLDSSRAPALHLESTTTLPGVDPWEVAWNATEGAAYILDSLAPQVLRAAFDPQLLTLPDRRAWVGIQSAEQLRRFASIRSLELGVSGQSDGLAIYDQSSFCFYHLRREEGRWQLQSLPLRQQASLSGGERYEIRQPETEAEPARLYLRGPVGAFEVIEAESEQRVAGGRIERAGEWTEFRPRPHLRAGSCYRIRSRSASVSTTSAIFRVLLRLGEPRPTASLQLGHARVVPIRRAGQGLQLGAVCTMALDSPSSMRSSEELRLILTQASASSSMHLPIAYVGEAAYLLGTTATLLPLPAVIDGVPKSVGCVVAWPAEPRVFGQYALFQFLAVDGRTRDVACSDVVGCQISLRR